MSVTDVCHIAYRDQVVETIRSLGQASTNDLCGLLPKTPAMLDAVSRISGADAAHFDLTPRWLMPYLRALHLDNQIASCGPYGNRWTVVDDRTEPGDGLVDPISSDVDVDGTTESDGGLTR